MYRYYVTVVLLVMLPVAGLCNTSDWQWNFNGVVFAGIASGASDGLDSRDVAMPYEPNVSHIAVYKESGVNGWDDTSGFYDYDIRSPLEMTPGTSKTWHIYVWSDLSLDPRYKHTGLSWFDHGIPDDARQSIEFRLTYVRTAVGVVDTVNTIGSYLILNNIPDGGSWYTFPACRVSNGLDGYIFDLTATVVPEPSSLLSLLCGLGGFGRLIELRKRK